MDSDDQTIIDGTVVSEADGAISKTDSPAVGGTADDLIAVTGLIQNYIVQIDRSSKELAAHKQMLQDAFLNDPTYRQHDEKVKEAVKVRNATKMQILKQPTLAELAEKVKDMAQSVKDAKQSLSDYLQEFAKMTGAREIEDSEGELREIVYSAKLIKAGSKEFKKKH
jgi:hypothetical protein